MNQICCRCKENKPLTEYHKDPLPPKGYSYCCKTCKLSALKKRYKNLPKEKKIEYHIKNREKRLLQQKIYDKNNRDKRREYYRKWEREKLLNDPVFKIRKYLSARLNSAMKNQKTSKKNKSILELCGISIELVAKHLELQFKEGMSWNNHGEWHIDHIIPVSSFNLLDPEEVKRACHYTNLQPLWAYDNLSKGNRAT
jgi:hypothetical protein